MNIQINITDCTMQEAQRMLQMLGWNPTLVVKTAEENDIKGEPSQLVANENKPEPIPDHLPLGEAVEAAKKENAKRQKAIVGTHKSGEIKYFDSVNKASGYCGVAVSSIYALVGKNKESRNGWKFEYDNGR